MRLAACEAARAFGKRVGHLLVHLGQCPFMHQRPDLDAFLAAMPDLQRGDAFGEGVAEAPVNRALYIDAVRGKAVLPRRGELCIDGDLHRLVDVRVVEDDQRCVAAEFHDQPFHRRRALRRDQAADLRRAGEAHGAHAGILAQRADDRLRVTRDDVEHAGRQACPLAKLRQRQRGKRRLRRRMRDHRAACGQRRRGLPGQHCAGKIPRRDEADDAHRLTPHHHLRAGQVAGHALGIHPFRFLRIPFDEGGRIVDLAARFRQGFPLFERHDQRKIVFGRDNELEPATQDRRALLRQKRPPWREGRLRGVDSRARLFGAERCHPGEAGASRRIGHLEAFSGAARRPASADIGELAVQPPVGKAVERVMA